MKQCGGKRIKTRSYFLCRRSRIQRKCGEKQKKPRNDHSFNQTHPRFLFSEKSRIMPSLTSLDIGQSTCGAERHNPSPVVSAYPSPRHFACKKFYSCCQIERCTYREFRFLFEIWKSPLRFTVQLAVMLEVPLGLSFADIW